MSAERSAEKALLDYLTDPEEGPDHLAQKTEQSQELYQQAEQQFESIVLGRLFVYMHVQLGSAMNPPHRQVTTYLATYAGCLIGTECTFIQTSDGSPITFITPIERLRYWSKEVKDQHLHDWLKLPWCALTEPFDSNDPMSAVRVVISDRRGSRIANAGLKAFFDFLVIYGAFISNIALTSTEELYYQQIKTFRDRLEGLRNSALNWWAHRLATVHEMYM